MFPDPNVDPKRVYLVGLDQNVKEKALINYFSKFGRVDKVTWNPESQEASTGQKWAVITFNEEASVQRILSQTRHIINKCTVTARAFRNRVR